MAETSTQLSLVSSPSGLGSKEHTTSTRKNKNSFSIRGVIGIGSSPAASDRKSLLDNREPSPAASLRVGGVDQDASRFRRPGSRRNLVPVMTTGFAIIGLLFLTSNLILILSPSARSYAQDPDSIFGKWGGPGTGTESLSWYPTDFLRDVIPIPAHSHNDYWRTVPLFSAIHVGCTGVEADVWHFDGESDLYIGHDLPSLTRNRTFATLYVNPLVELLQLTNPTTTTAASFCSPPGEGKCCCRNGIFDTDRRQSLVLLVDVKTDGAETWPLVMAQLQPLRERGWLSYVDDDGEAVMGPVTVVGTGNTPFDLLVGNTTFRDAFFDAPLDKMYEDEDHVVGGQYDVYNATNSFYASASIGGALGPVWYAAGGVSEYQLHVMRGQIRGAHRRGLKVRYWSLPAWPRGFRNEIWKLLVEEGVDYLNVDDMMGVSMFDLEPVPQMGLAHSRRRL